MSSDQQVLAAIATKTRQEMRYFELVKASCGDQRWTCFLCLGKHAMFFIRQDLKGKLHDGWELFYAYIIKVVQDTNTDTAAMFVLNDNKSPKWKSDRLFIMSDNRELLLKHLRCNWQTDHMWRVGSVAVFPLSMHVITKDKVPPPVMPFQKHRWVKYAHYYHLLPYEFRGQANSIQVDNTGEYINDNGVTIVMHVHEQLTMDQLVLLKREHLRWVAAEYKVQLVQEEKQFYVLRNQQRWKRMNITGDIAAWHGWEIIIRTRSATLICLLLRRQYIPPVCNCAQDIAVIVRCPAAPDGQVPNFKELLLESHLIADSVYPDANAVTPYRDIVQAKMDGLRFDEDSVDWIRSHVKLNTKWHNYAKAFVRALLKVYIGGSPRQFDDSLLEVLAECDAGDDEMEEAPTVDLEDLDTIISHMRSVCDGQFMQESTSLEEDIQRTKVRNFWYARVARYFVWAVDGGMMQSKFTLDVMIENITSLPENYFKQAVTALRFMLHLRLTDMTKAYVEAPLVQTIKERNLKEWNFSDRVMQVILNQDYLRKQLGRQKEGDYLTCLAHLLESNAGTNLKAYVCRIFMERGNEKKAQQGEDVSVQVVPPLIELLKSGQIFLATYASAALVNLSDGNDAVKMCLMTLGIANVAVKNVKTKDDELICYTLMLLVNLTKQPHHRNMMANGGLLPQLYDLLTSSYHQCRSSAGGRSVSSVSVVGGVMKERLLTQVSILIGHFCIDELYRQMFLDEERYGHTVPCLLYMFDNSTVGSSLMCKVMFVLKQLCKDRADQKQNIGAHCARHLIERLADKDVEKTPEFIFQALLLLQMLATMNTNCEIMDKYDLIAVLDELGDQPVSGKVHEFDRRVEQLKSDITRTVNKDIEMAA